MKYSLLFLTFFSILQSKAQYVNFGYNLSQNTYVESKLDNLSTQFNLGWEIDESTLGYLIEFYPDGTEFDVKNKLNWNKSSSGFVFGVGADPDLNDLSYEFNFTGHINKQSGTRVNLTTGAEENFSLKSKFGGFNFLLGYKLNEIIRLNFGIGAHVFKVKYSWESATQNIKNQIIGLRINPLSQKIKVGSRSVTLNFPVGATFKVYELGDFSFHTRLNYNFVWNSFLETELITYLPYRFNMNHLSLTLFTAYTF